MTSFFDEFPELRGIESMDAFRCGWTMARKLAEIRKELMAFLIEQGIAILDGWDASLDEPLYRFPDGFTIDPGWLIRREGAVLDKLASTRPGERILGARLAAFLTVWQYRIFAARVRREYERRGSLRVAA
jgi:hypothetical protein